MDRLDEKSPVLDIGYGVNGYDGTGSTIYVFDTGIGCNPTTNPTGSAKKICDEFLRNDGTGTSRLTVWDVNDALDPFHPSGVDSNGIDLNGHGTQVAVAAVGNTYGIARGANVISVRLSIGKDVPANNVGKVEATNGLISSVEPLRLTG